MKTRLLKLDSLEIKELRTHLKLKWRHYHPNPWKKPNWPNSIEWELWRIIYQELTPAWEELVNA